MAALSPIQFFKEQWKKGLTPEQLADDADKAKRVAGKKAAARKSRAKADEQAKGQPKKAKPTELRNRRARRGDGVSFNIESPSHTIKELFFGSHGFNIALILSGMLSAMRAAVSGFVAATAAGAAQSRSVVAAPAAGKFLAQPPKTVASRRRSLRKIAVGGGNGGGSSITSPDDAPAPFSDRAKMIAATENRSLEITEGKSKYLFVMIARQLKKLQDFTRESPFADRRFSASIVNMLHPEMSSWLSAVYSSGASADYAYDFIMDELKELHAKGFCTDDALCVMETRLTGYVEKWHQANLAFSAPAPNNTPKAEADGEGGGGGGGLKNKAATNTEALPQSQKNDLEEPAVPVPPWMK